MAISAQTILTHPGGAHKDDFLACCILVHTHRAPVVRREPEESDLEAKERIVVDVGGRHEPEKGNFDHHQFPRDSEPVCALSLVLKHLGLYEDARQFCDWLETAERMDCRGPVETAKWLGVERLAMDRLLSPMDVTLLRRFAQVSELHPGEPLWEVMAMIGEDLVTFVESLRQRLDFVGQHAEFWDLGEAGEALYMPRTDPLPSEPSAGLGRFVSLRHPERRVIALVYPDRRGVGYGLSRYQDNPVMEYTRINEESDVHFAHARGFVAKTSAVDPGRLLQLLQKSVVEN
jgi:hypothetical protein